MEKIVDIVLRLRLRACIVLLLLEELPHEAIPLFLAIFGAARMCFHGHAINGRLDYVDEEQRSAYGHKSRGRSGAAAIYAAIEEAAQSQQTRSHLRCW